MLRAAFVEMDSSSGVNLPWANHAMAQKILTYVQIAYPILLLFVYLIAFTVRSIVTSSSRDESNDTSEPEQLG